jgi:type IV secretory pathway TrbD component
MADTVERLTAERHPVYLSLTRVVLLGGAPRPFVFFEALLVAILVLGVGPHVPTFALAALWVLACNPLAVALARRDPLVAELYLRSLSWGDYYPALPALQARSHRVYAGLAHG